MTACDCGSGRPFDACCGRYLRGEALPETAEALMRSRYSAYARGEVDYLVRTHAPETRSPTLREDVAAWVAAARFTGLSVSATEGGGPGDTTGFVTFTARFTEGGRAQALAERSRFARHEGAWVYVDGTPAPVKAAVKVGRNDPCPCGSGRKHKACCGR